jgi:signal transduction histidine kinase
VTLAIGIGTLALFDLMIATFLVIDAGSAPQGGSVTTVTAPLLSPLLASLALAATVRRRSDPLVLPSLLAVAAMVVPVAAVVVNSEGVPSFAAAAALLVLTLRSVAILPRGQAAAAAAMGAGALVMTAIAPSLDGGTGAAAATALVFATGAIAAGLYLRWVRWSQQSAATAARTDERLQMARELHDSIGHHVTGIIVQAQAARLVAERNPAAATAALERIEREGSAALQAMRAVVADLRDDVPTVPHDDWSNLDAVVAGATGRGVPLRVTVDPTARQLRGPIVAATSRIVTEALTNVERHARSVTLVAVDVVVDGDHLVVQISDDGVAVESQGQGSFGLVGMRERAEALGGTLQVGPVPGGGWLVRAALPRRISS